MRRANMSKYVSGPRDARYNTRPGSMCPPHASFPSEPAARDGAQATDRPDFRASVLFARGILRQRLFTRRTTDVDKKVGNHAC
ncbi:hypothetical protein C3920_00910 [Novacetimonas pomaceti]|uniref:Uncharacterized protein n=1 Tax=Novacetimonas pomaceti TaxID=2021998 RepID=A0ABX5PB83_9PROT|nr:hypothetical protein C3920_00910 [Novacetimonas pomaceti]